MPSVKLWASTGQRTDRGVLRHKAGAPFADLADSSATTITACSLGGVELDRPTAKYVIGIEWPDATRRSRRRRSAKTRRARVLRSAARQSGRRPAARSSAYLFAHETRAQSRPWDEDRRFAGGEYARARRAEAPTRVVSSAKSCRSTRVRSQPAVLPLGAPADVERYSPSKASSATPITWKPGKPNKPRGADGLLLAEQEVGWKCRPRSMRPRAS